MRYRTAKREDLEQLLEIVEDAKIYMRENGFEQWNHTYPRAEHILEDIEKEECYIWEEEGVILGMTSVSFDGEPIYDTIEGAWNTEYPYGTIHRFAVAKKARGQGIASKLLALGEQLCIERGYKGIRVDTHKQNKTMQRFLEKHGYMSCGIIYYEEKLGDPSRLAYDKFLNQ